MKVIITWVVMMTTVTANKKPTKTTITVKYGYIWMKYTYIHAHTHAHTHIHIHIQTYICKYIHTHMHKYMYIDMIKPNNALHTIVTLPQIKDILATTTAKTIVKITARTNNTRKMETRPETLTETIITIKETMIIILVTINRKVKLELTK